MKPGTEINKKNTTTSENFDDDVMSGNFDVIVIFPIYGQSGAIRKLDSGYWSVILTFSLTVTFFLQKLKTELKHSNAIALSKRTIFAKKC